jgi:uncharacterized membrane protein
MRRILFMLVFLTVFLPGTVFAFSVDDPNATTITETAEVMGISSTSDEIIPGTSAISHVQILRAHIIDGPDKGSIVTVHNDYAVVAIGDRVLISKETYQTGETNFFVHDIDRRMGLLLLAIFGAGVVILFSGMVGLRAIISLLASIAAIIFILLPLLLKGLPPVPIAIAVSAGILCIVMYLTHGWNRITHAAFVGTVITILITGILSTVAVAMLNLSGYSADEAVYLNLAAGARLDLRGLLLAGIIIGVLGVLNDVAITQAAIIAELRHDDPDLSFRKLYFRAMRIGREHIGGLVNTLALAYTGASLPLLLLIIQLPTPFSLLINQEILAVEIVRTVMGTIALTLAVPITTALAICFRVSAKESGHSHAHHH